MKDNTGTLKELTERQIAEIAYEASAQLQRVADPAISQVAFSMLDPADLKIFMAQISAIIKNPRIKPMQLHQHFMVAAQQLIARGEIEKNKTAILDAYMIPFNELDEITRTKYRLQVQLVRIMVRHNRNVQHKRQWQR
jgi:hypothetical protein